MLGFAQVTGDAVWSEPFKQYDNANKVYLLDADRAITRLKQWRTETSGLPVNDHAMLFTR